MKDIHKWYADKCGIKTTDFGWKCDSAKKAGNGKFRIEECVCREIIREIFLIETSVSGEEWVSESNSGLGISYEKTIAEAEIACLEAIYESEKE